MKKICLLILSSVLCEFTSALTFYSKASLNVDLPSSWNTASDGSGTDAVSSDFSGGNTFIIQTGHSMSSSASWTISGSGSQLQIQNNGSLSMSHAMSLSQLIISSGGSLSIPAGITLTITNGNPLGFDLQVSGQLSNAGLLSYGSSATGTFLASAVYRHMYTSSAGTVPAATWNNSSTCEIAGYTSNASTPGGLGQSFGNFTWNCTGQATNINLSGNLQTVNGDFALSSCGSGTLRLTASASPSVSVGGNFIVNAGTLNLSSGTGVASLYLNGDFHVASGANITESGTGSASLYFIKSGTQTFDLDGSALNDISYNIQLGSTLQLLSDLSINSGNTVTVSGNLNSGVYSVSGEGAFQLQSGGKFITAKQNGISGAILSSGSNSFSSNASFEFSGNNVNLKLASFGISALKELVLSGSGIDTLDTDIDISTSLNFSNTKLLLNNYDLRINSSASISGAGSSAYIVADSSGLLLQTVNAGSNVSFPVGTGSCYFPVTISLSAASVTDEFSVRVKGSVLLNASSGTALSSNVVNATWFIDEGTAGNSSTDLTFQWPASAELSSFDRSNAFVSHYSVAWDLDLPSAANGSDPYTLTRSGISSFSAFSVGDDNSALPVTWLFFEGKRTGNKNTLKWATASEWNNKEFRIEASEDAIHFMQLGTMPAMHENGSGHEYVFTHETAMPGTYYRILQLDLNGNADYSILIYVGTDGENPLFIYDQDRKLLRCSSGAQLRIMDLRGCCVFSKQACTGSSEIDLSTLNRGIYIVLTGNELFRILIE